MIHSTGAIEISVHGFALSSLESLAPAYESLEMQPATPPHSYPSNSEHSDDQRASTIDLTSDLNSSPLEYFKHGKLRSESTSGGNVLGTNECGKQREDTIHVAENRRPPVSKKRKRQSRASGQ